MPKERKVKRYRKIYRQDTSVSLAFKWAIAIVLICTLGFIGWSAYGPVMEQLSALASKELPTSSSSISSLPSINETEPTEPVVNPEPSPEEPSAPASEETDPVRAAYLPYAVLLDPQRLDAALTNFSSANINAVMFDLKDDRGSVLYQSNLEQVKLVRGKDTYAQFDLAALCKTLTDRGFTPIGRLNGFRDHIAALRIPDASVLYRNSKMNWLDNSPDAGGRAWLNPYSPQAQTYLIDLAVEAASMGVSQIMLANFSFPIGYGLEFADYGATAATKTKDQVLIAFLSELEQKISQAGAELNLYLSGPAALGAHDAFYGDKNPLSFTKSAVTVNISPMQFGEQFALNDFTIPTPAADPNATASALLGQISSTIDGRPMTGLVLAGANIYVDPANAIQGQLDALSKAGIENYILYSQDGVYPTLSGG